LDGETVAILERHRHVVDERMPQPSTAFLFSDELDGSRPDIWRYLEEVGERGLTASYDDYR